VVKTLKGLPVSVIVVLVALPACKVKVSCGGAPSDDSDDKVVTTASLEGIALVTKSTHPVIKPDMRCKVVVDKTADKELAEARVNCFAGDSSGGIVVYTGSSATISYEPRTASEADDRILYIDESAKVRTRIEFDRMKNPPGTMVVWSTDPSWEITCEAPSKEKQ
jgi:hypothetical protein